MYFSELDQKTYERSITNLEDLITYINKSNQEKYKGRGFCIIAVEVANNVEKIYDIDHKVDKS